MKTLLLLLLLAGGGLYLYLHSKNADPELNKKVQNYAAELKTGVKKAQEAGKKAGAEFEKIKAATAKNIDKAKTLRQDAENALEKAKR